MKKINLLILIFVFLSSISFAQYSVTFHVMKPDGGNLSSASVTYNGATQNTNYSGLTTFTNVPAGTQSYSITKNHYLDATGDVTVVDQDITVDVTMDWLLYDQTFTVVDENANPVEGALVTMGDYSATTDASGVAVVGVNNGSHKWWITGVGYIKANGNKYVTSANSYSVTLLDNIQNGWEWIDLGLTSIVYAMSFPGDQSLVGYACGSSLTYNGDGFIYKTTDGGDNWVSLTDTIDIPGMYDVEFVDELTGYAAGQGETFMKTTDGGETWTITTISGASEINDMDFYNDTTGVMVSYLGVSYTTDGGDTWTVSTGTSGQHHAIQYVDEMTLFAAGMTKIEKSTDGGVTWSQVYYTPGSVLLGVNFIDEKLGYVVGDYGQIIKTDNGGATWTSVNIDDQLFHDIHICDEDNAFVFGTPEIIYNTIDGGSSWNSAYPTSWMYAFHDVEVTSDDIAFVSASGGNIVRKTLEYISDYTLTFNVDNGADPIEGATVIINSETLTTNESGIAEIELLEGVYDYTVDYGFCAQYSGTVTIEGGDITEVVSMDCPDSYYVTFIVDDGENPIEGASIEINSETLTTDVSGTAEIFLMEGEYSYTVDYGLCDQYSGTITIEGGDLTENISMSCPPEYIVTFILDMTAPIADGTFIPGTDAVYISGSAWGDAEPGTDPNLELTDIDLNGVYTAVFEIIDGDYEYNYYKNAGWDGIEETGVVRTFTVDGEDVVLQDVWGSMLGVNELNSSIYGVWPNPSNGTININTEDECKLEVVDMMGKVIETRTIDGSTEINIENKGIYFLRFSNAEGIYTQKVIVK